MDLEIHSWFEKDKDTIYTIQSYMYMKETLLVSLRLLFRPIRLGTLGKKIPSRRYMFSAVSIEDEYITAATGLGVGCLLHPPKSPSSPYLGFYVS